MSETRSQPKQAVSLRIEKPVYGGAGLARHQGKVIFVPHTLPGEFVEAVVTNGKASFAEASLVSVLEASADRVAPPCPYFASCGGCDYQHASYAAQLAMKQAILKETLARARLADLPEMTTHAGVPFGYRNRIRLHIDPATFALGYRQRGSHHLIHVTLCPIAAPLLERALGALSQISADQQCGSYFAQVELSVNHDASALLMALLARPGARMEEAGPRLTRMCEALRAQAPALLGSAVHAAGPEPAARHAVLAGRPKRSRATRQDEKPDPLLEDTPGALLAQWGATHMHYRVGALDYGVSLGAFFQINRTLIDELVTVATSNSRGRLAWDLYAGVGLFSKVLATRFGRVVAVEGAPVSCADLRANLSPGHQAVQSSTLDFLRREAARLRRGSAKSETPDFVLVDPPRAGLGEEVARLLAQIGPQDITYVSCDPATLSRDLRTLIDSSYQLQQLHLVDLFPQTFHLEAVVMLSRR